MAQADLRLTIAFAATCLIAAALTAGFVFASGYAIGAIPAAVRDGSGSAALRRVELAAVVMAGVFIAQQVFSALQDQLASTLGRRIEGDLRSRLFRALAAPARLGHLEDPVVRRLIASASTVGTARYGVASALDFGVASINGVLVGIWMTVLLATFRWWLALPLAAMWLVIRTFVHREALAYWAVLGFQTSGSQRSVYFRDLALTPPAAKEVRIFGLGDWIVDRFTEHWSRSAGRETARRASSHVSLGIVVPVVAVHVAAFLVAVHAIRSGSIDLRQFAVAVQAIAGVAILGVSWRDQVVVAWGAATIPPVWELEKRMADLAAAVPPATTAPAASGPIVFDAISFSYPGSPARVLDGLDLTIDPGRSLALVGSNGAGKTTLVKILCGLLEPTAGRVLLDGVPLGDIDPVAWRRRVAVLFQDFVRYPFTAADNVRFGAIEASGDEDLLEAVAARAGVGEVVGRLPGGWDTPMSRQFAGGADLSGGEWQRLALARTLWAVQAGATVLILDEPTANLDVRAEARFYEQFLELTRGLTTVLVSHRFASVRQADRICVLQAGRVAEQGTHESLVSLGRMYAAMFDAQAAAYRQDLVKDA